MYVHEVGESQTDVLVCVFVCVLVDGGGGRGTTVAGAFCG